VKGDEAGDGVEEEEEEEEDVWLMETLSKEQAPVVFPAQVT
jgi:hypothetical protein